MQEKDYFPGSELIWPAEWFKCQNHTSKKAGKWSQEHEKRGESRDESRVGKDGEQNLPI